MVIAVLILKPWNAARPDPHGPKADLIAHLEDGMSERGVPASVAKCFTGGLDREFTDADALLFNRVFSSGESEAQVAADPAYRGVIEKMGRVGSECARELLGIDGDSSAEAATALAGIR
jgi:hypothetical protein